MSFLLDLLALLILAFCIWHGYRKGFIITVAGVIIVIISAWAGGRIASGYSEDFAEKLRPILGWVADGAVDEASVGKGRLSEITDIGVLTEIARESLNSLGVHFSDGADILDDIFNDFGNAAYNFREEVSFAFIRSISGMILAVFGFIAVFILLTLLMYFISSIFKLPGFKLLDKTGGAAAGFVYGFLFLSVLGWILRYTGYLISLEVIDKTLLIKLFFNMNLLTGLLGRF